MRDLKEAKAFVSELKKLGCSFAIDDFGAGFTSFSYIRQLNVDFVKIDGAFIKNIDKSEEDRLFVKALVDLAQGLRIKTIAEFVETKEAMVYLQQLGVDFVQGYYLSKPQPDLSTVTKQFEGKSASNFKE
jgi:EAL domain-containing protein (putative c-di-GMP-specific phosphodiesterase class I)